MAKIAPAMADKRAIAVNPRAGTIQLPFCLGFLLVLLGGLRRGFVVLDFRTEDCTATLPHTPLKVSGRFRLRYTKIIASEEE
ncbi:MAG: hypothetical protein ACKN9E_16745 [Microcystaceae cyanobacterium]